MHRTGWHWCEEDTASGSGWLRIQQADACMCDLDCSIMPVWCRDKMWNPALQMFSRKSRKIYTRRPFPSIPTMMPHEFLGVAWKAAWVPFICKVFQMPLKWTAFLWVLDYLGHLVMTLWVCLSYMVVRYTEKKKSIKRQSSAAGLSSCRRVQWLTATATALLTRPDAFTTVSELAGCYFKCQFYYF